MGDIFVAQGPPEPTSGVEMNKNASLGDAAGEVDPASPEEQQGVVDAKAEKKQLLWICFRSVKTVSEYKWRQIARDMDGSWNGVRLEYKNMLESRFGETAERRVALTLGEAAEDEANGVTPACDRGSGTTPSKATKARAPKATKATKATKTAASKVTKSRGTGKRGGRGSGGAGGSGASQCAAT